VALPSPALHITSKLRYPHVHHGQMKRLGYGVYVPPAPPRQPTLDVNRRQAPAPVIEWRLSNSARWRMIDSPHPRTQITAIWTCPVCSASVPRLRRAGRHRVYCTNACRQRAYRLRCKSRQQHPMSAHRDPRPARATTRDRVHAIREYADVSSGRRDSIGRVSPPVERSDGCRSILRRASATFASPRPRASPTRIDAADANNSAASHPARRMIKAPRGSKETDSDTRVPALGTHHNDSAVSRQEEPLLVFSNH
jgi:hypothetical protein